MWSRIQMNSRNKDNPKIGQQRTILRQWSASANQTIKATSAVLTWGLEGDAPLGGWNADGKEAVPVTRNATPPPNFAPPHRSFNSILERVVRAFA
jgi:hypothetical protein